MKDINTNLYVSRLSSSLFLPIIYANRSLRNIAHSERCKVHALLESPTLLRVFTAFNRDLTKMGINGALFIVHTTLTVLILSDWRVIAPVVIRELKNLPTRPKRKHVHMKLPPPRLVIEYQCTECPASTRHFSASGLRNHYLAVHVIFYLPS
jgi:hypothetical protein